MRKLTLILITALAASTAFSQTPKPIDAPPPVQGDANGFYRLTVKNGKSQKTSEITVYFRRSGDILEMYDLASKRKYTSEIQQTRAVGISGTVVINFAVFELKGREKEMAPNLLVVLTEEKGLYAFGISKKQQMEVVVESLASVWACGNHQNPTHTAKSETEMRQQTSTHGCSLWYKLNSSAMQ